VLGQLLNKYEYFILCNESLRFVRMDFDLCKAFGLEFIEMFINKIIFKLKHDYL